MRKYMSGRDHACRAERAGQRRDKRAATADERLQRASDGHDRRGAAGVHERLPKRQVRLDQEAALRQRQTMRQQLHRQGQGLPPIGLAAPDAGDRPLSVGGQLRR